jgi:hypothetical protein
MMLLSPATRCAIWLLILGSGLAASIKPAAAELIAQTCRVDSLTKAPAALRADMEKFRASSVEICDQTDQRKTNYFAFGALEREDGACVFSVKAYLPDEPPTQWRSMARVGKNCPSPSLENYVNALGISSKDFIAITDFFNRPEQKQKLTHALLPLWRNGWSLSQDRLQKELAGNRPIHIDGIEGKGGFWGLFSTYRVKSVNHDDRASGFDFLLTRFFWGQWLVLRADFWIA